MLFAAVPCLISCKLALDPAAVFSSSKGVTFARITLFSYCINHESNSTGKHIYHQPSPVTSIIWFLLSSHQHQIEHYQPTDSNCMRKVVNKKIIFFSPWEMSNLTCLFLLPPPQPNFLIFPNNREQNFRKHIIENNITEDRTS